MFTRTRERFFRNPREDILCPRLALLSTTANILPLGCAVALSMRKLLNVPTVIVCCIGDCEFPQVKFPANPNTKKVNTVLQRHGLHSVAVGKLVMMKLSVTDDKLSSKINRVSSAGRAPVVFCFGTPRTPKLDDLLEENNYVLVVTTENDSEQIGRKAGEEIENLSLNVKVTKIDADDLLYPLALSGYVQSSSSAKSISPSLVQLLSGD